MTSELHAFAQRYYDAINARDFDAYGALLDDCVEYCSDTMVTQGREATLASRERVLLSMPGVRFSLDRVVAHTANSIVVELSLVNPDADAGAWRLAGRQCEILEFRAGRVAAIRSYYSPHPDDRLLGAPIPSRSHGVRLLAEQRALRRVATLVARGVAEDELLTVVNSEISTLLGSEATALLRLDAGILPQDAETLIAGFTELLATALANSQARAELQRLADEQAALGRVSDLVARGAPEPEVFGAIVREAYELLDTEFTALASYEPDGSSRIVAVHNAPDRLTVGTRVATGNGLVEQIRRTAGPVRLDTYEGLSGEDAAYVRGLGVTAGVGVPILIDGHVWGAFIALAGQQALPAGIEQRLARFADVASTAISGAQARAELRDLAEEQAALRRLAELAARGATPQEAFDAVVVEVFRLLRIEIATLLRYEPDGDAVIVAAHGTPTVRVGERQRGGGGVVEAVQQTGRCSRVNYADIPGPGPLIARDRGFVCSVGVPVYIEGRLWGMLGAASSKQPLSSAVEAHLAKFGELIGTVIAGTQAQLELQELAAEQAALRRVAELVARGVGQTELFETVAREASRLIDQEGASLLRFEGEGRCTCVGNWNGSVPVGATPTISLDDIGVVAEVMRTGRPARRDTYVERQGVAWARDDLDISSAVGVPIFVEDKLWGLLGVSKPKRALADNAPDQGLSSGAERRLLQFAELVAAAVANAQARAEVQQLADEQAALRRVAELAARGVPPEEVFDAVAKEASALVNDEAMTLTRFDGPAESTVMAVHNGPAPSGGTVTLEPGPIIDRVRSTGRPARIDDYASIPDAGLAEDLGMTVGCVAVPVTVGGRVWGLLAATSHLRNLPAETEHRLGQFAEIVGAAIANAEGKEQLRASRARVVATADETRRKLQRDVHDGAQQRLVQTVITLKLARDALSDSPGPARDLVEESLDSAERATSELGNLVRGILPASLTRGGLRTGLESLISNFTLPVDLHIAAPRLPPEIETTAYFVVAEALTNVVKHAKAGNVRVALAIDDDDNLTIDVLDDGIGGADPAAGTGLTGLFDRVGASNGTLVIVSPAGDGTDLRATLPLAN